MPKKIMQNKKCGMEEYIFTSNLKSFIAPFSNIMAHHFLLNLQLFKFFSVSFGVIFCENLGNNILFV